MPYKKIDISALQARLSEFNLEPETSIYTPQIVHQKPKNSIFSKLADFFTLDQRTGAFVSTFVIAAAGIGVAIALPNGSSSASEVQNTDSLQTAIESLKTENTELRDEVIKLKKDQRIEKQKEVLGKKTPEKPVISTENTDKATNSQITLPQ
jgi:cell division protein FtsL